MVGTYCQGIITLAWIVKLGVLVGDPFRIKKWPPARECWWPDIVPVQEGRKCHKITISH